MSTAVVLTLGIVFALLGLLAAIAFLRSNAIMSARLVESNKLLVEGLIACKAGHATAEMMAAMQAAAEPRSSNNRMPEYDYEPVQTPL